MPADWLVAYDDYLCARWQHCIWCGAPGHIMELRSTGDFALTFTWDEPAHRWTPAVPCGAPGEQRDAEGVPWCVEHFGVST
jgi:hypothetical protein